MPGVSATTWPWWAAGCVGAATAYELGAPGARTVLVRPRPTRAGDRRRRRDPLARDGRARRRGVGRALRARGRALRRAAAAARRRHRLGAVRHPQAGDARHRRARVGVGRGARAGAHEISADDARAWCPVLGDVVRACIIRTRRASTGADARRCAPRSTHGVEVRTGASTTSAAPAMSTRDRAGAVVIAGGAWTRASRRAARRALPVGPLRGQIMHLDVPEHDTGAWPIVQPVYGHYMVPWADAHVAVGATVEDAGFATDVTAGGVHEVLRETLRVMPGLAPATLREVRVGLRPCERRRHADHRRGCPADNVFVAPATARTACCSAGHGASSPTSCSATAPRLDLAPFSPAALRLTRSDRLPAVASAHRSERGRGQ